METQTILILSIVVAVLIIALLIWLLIKKTTTLSKYEKEYKGIIDVDKEINRKKKEFSKTESELQKQLDDTKDKLSKLKEKYQTASKAYDELNSQNNLLKDTLDIAEFGVYEPHFELDTSEEYKKKIIENKEKQKTKIKNETAAKCFTNWSVGNSQKKGEVMTKRGIKLTLRAFNGECDSMVAKVKWNNIEQYEKRIEKIFNAINNLNKSNDIHIQGDYLNLKIEELRLTHEYQLKKYEEKEEQRVIREQMREEEKARRDFERAQKEAEKEEKMLQKAMEKAQAEIAKASEEERERYEAQLAELGIKLKEAEEKNQRAISMAQQTKSGHVYVISNIGSFGENIYKIGMTRRLEPLDRVKELGDASVPFKFDVHALIYSENAPELETQLHKAFNNKRLNHINLRREYFDITLNEIEAIVRENHGDIEFTKIAEAKEYRESLVIKEKILKGQEEVVLKPVFPSSEALFDD